MGIEFFVTSVLFGVGLAMDAFSVSVARGLTETNLSKSKVCLIAGVFGGFQIGMPLLGWVLVSMAAQVFAQIQKVVPWAALIMLTIIGGHMIWEGIHNTPEKAVEEELEVGTGMKMLLLQGVATSIDALSVGLDTAGFSFVEAFVEALIIGIVTFFICVVGLVAGNCIGGKIGAKAPILGGVILIGIGIKIFLGSL